ncbi:RagB/SusD family nutrient uptake outer membrane protein [Tenacibaculum sp. Mcav3-52]|uniref:RagB/SusD family nutrient uptake outer membrane protein n=1 Tax=Tenacibaculum mesophilum TaxID=104268 RepID=A0ABM7CFF9_9FLAO|nr:MULTISPECIES: RagB/SusD family nutrient uptake outer membrane protein [Tenacibaculum]AZJ32506.1 RagB/SusD family nutrient uptake outer membrane protein [Tenacibaculum mesophilum]MCG7501399.1 RagB/SusD family nutrient uptake outer membrane protein [Tenacibaculum sp. Mcav3-52]QFS27756.1 RagB/SusD family nutrient uptake outer membrane protein [Tenacibaculum mesophilum]SHG09297.1 SusD family protein [Tenacibaculum mesophilum]
MKKHIYILLISIVSIVSCDDYLDIEPVGQVIPKSVEDYRSFLTTAYATEKNNHILTTYRADELQLSKSSVGSEQYEDIYLWNDASASPLTTPFSYASFYKIIFHANHVIEKETEITGDATAITQLVGEAYALRALQYFQLINLYAKAYDTTTASNDNGVPIVTKYNLDQKYDIQSVEEVYTQILSDLSNAEARLNIEQQASGFNYRFSKIALKSLKARVYLYKKEWQKAIDVSKEALAIKNTIQDLNSDSSIMPSEFSSVESILALDQVSSFDIASNAAVSDQFLNKYDRINDLRFNIYFKKDGTVYRAAKTADLKYKSTFRVAELYLTLAEAYTQLNELTFAKEQLLVLVKNRYTPAKVITYTTYINSLTKQQLYEEILDERAREFAIEGQRWNDLKRTTQPEITKWYEGKNYTLNKNDSRYVVQFPNDAKINNPNF